ALHRRSGELRGLANDQNNLGNVLQQAGDLNGARDAYRQSYELAVSINEEAIAETPLANLAYLEMEEGSLSRSAAHYAQALAISKRLGNRLEEANLREQQGILAQVRGDFRSAITEYTAAASILRLTGSSLSTNDLDV